MKKIFVGNLPWKATEDALKVLFEAHGKVVSVKIVLDPYTGKSRGFGFVEMEEADGAQAAIRELDNKPFLERNLRVSLAQERTDSPRPPRREGGREGGGREGGFGGGRDSREGGRPGGRSNFAGRGNR